MPLGSVQKVGTAENVRVCSAQPVMDGQPTHSANRNIQGLMVKYVVLVGKEHSKSAFAALFAYYAPKINQYMLKMGASNACAEELTQEVFLAVWNKAHQYCPRKALVSTWLYTIARNKFFDLKRRERRVQLNSILYPTETREVEKVDEHLARIQVQKEVKEALGELPKDQYEIVFKMYMEGKTQDCIAAELKLPVGTVKSRARLAYVRLRRELDIDA